MATPYSNPPTQSPRSKQFRHQIERKEVRKLKARQSRSRSLWFGLGLSGLMGWSVAIPTLLGIHLGIWIDQRFPSRLSWTLMMMISGLFLGCWNAWIWLQKERQR